VATGITGAASPAGAAGSASAVLAPWQQWIAVGLVTGAIGFYLGRRFADPLPAVAQQTTLATTAPAVTEASPALTAHAEAASVAELGTHTVATSRTSSGELRRSATKVTAARPSAQRSADFLQAVQLLARARRALERGEPALALGLLDELDSRFPREMLDEERGATRVLGLCANGEQPAAVELAQRLFAGRQRSIYTRRIERSCVGAALTAHSKP